MVRRVDPVSRRIRIATAEPMPERSSVVTYFFFDKTSRIAHFQLESAADGSLPVDQAAAMLAMHCVVRKQAPDEYTIMTSVETHPDLLEKTKHLIDVGNSVRGGTHLTRREEEVLKGVLASQANKEIGISLNVSERTVKFHVSSLLAKFNVRGRMELAAVCR